MLFVHYRLDGGNCGGFYILICCTSKGKSLLSCLKRGYGGKNILLYTVLGLKIRHSRDGGGEGRWFKSGILASGYDEFYALWAILSHSNHHLLGLVHILKPYTFQFDFCTDEISIKNL